MVVAGVKLHRSEQEAEVGVNFVTPLLPGTVSLVSDPLLTPPLLFFSSSIFMTTLYQ